MREKYGSATKEFPVQKCHFFLKPAKMTFLFPLFCKIGEQRVEKVLQGVGGGSIKIRGERKWGRDVGRCIW
jgi:hypothetical protein